MRYEAALVAGDKVAQAQQLAALEGYVHETSPLIAAVADSLDDFIDALEATMGPQQVTQSDVQAYQGELMENGFSASDVDLFGEFGLTSSQISELEVAIGSADAAGVAGELMTGLRQLPAVYREVAVLTSLPVAVPSLTPPGAIFLMCSVLLTAARALNRGSSRR